MLQMLSVGVMMTNPYVDELIGQLANSDGVVRNQAKIHLAAMGEEAIDPLIQVMRSGSERMKWEAANVLCQFENARCIEPMLEALTSSSLMLQHVAIEALERYNLSSLVPALIRLLPSCHCSVQARIANLLGKTGDQRAVHPLMDLLPKTDSSLLRLSIIQALGVLGDPQAIELIRAFQDDEDPHVRKRARAALLRLETYRSFGSDQATNE
jgi:HEAT repeat protein